MWTATAVFLYLFPIFGFCLARRASGRDALSVALDVPLAVGCDFLLILVASRVLVLDYAALVVRGVEGVGLAWLVYRRRAGLRAAVSLLALRELVTPALGALLALFLSTRISVPYAIWDRHWHIPLVASLRGQHAPFHNVYEPGRHIFYHYAGDALAAVFQALSFSHLHASAALSRAHDVMYALTGLCLCQTLRAVGARGSVLPLLVVWCTLAGGPATVLLDGTQRPGTGWSTINLLSLSFRPHEPLSYMFAIALVVAGMGPLLRDRFSVRRDAVPVLAASASLLALSDEPTLAVAVGTIGVAWLVAPQSAAGRWRERLWVLLTPLGATLLTLLVLGGTFSLGAPRQAIELVSPRLPGFYLPSLKLGTSNGLDKFFSDYLGPIGVMLAALVSALGRKSGLGWTLLTAHVALFVASLAILTMVKVNHDDMESHRAVTALMLLSPLLLAFWFARLPAGELRAWVLGLGGLACVGGAVSSLEWVRGVIQVDAPRLHSFWGDDWFYDTDCVATTGARLGERPLISIGPQTSWYAFGGCRPVFAVAGGPPGGHAIVVGWPDAETTAFAKVAEWAPTSADDIRLFYPRALAGHDIVADRIRINASHCRPAGKDFVECRLRPQEYLSLVDALARGKHKRGG